MLNKKQLFFAEMIEASSFSFIFFKGKPTPDGEGSGWCLGYLQMGSQVSKGGMISNRKQNKRWGGGMGGGTGRDGWRNGEGWWRERERWLREGWGNDGMVKGWVDGWRMGWGMVKAWWRDSWGMVEGWRRHGGGMGGVGNSAAPAESGGNWTPV